MLFSLEDMESGVKAAPAGTCSRRGVFRAVSAEVGRPSKISGYRQVSLADHKSLVLLWQVTAGQ